MSRKLLRLMLSTALLAGCGSNSLRPASVSEPPQPAAEREATAILLQAGTCAAPVAGHAGGSALIGAAIGVVADFAVSALTAELRRQRDGRNASWVATGSVNQLRPGPQARRFCLWVGRGAVLPGGIGQLNFREYPVFLMKVDLALEAVPAGVQDEGTAVALIARPYELRYADTSAPVRGSGRKNVSVILALSPQTLQPTSAAAVPDTAEAAVLRLDLGRLEVGRTYDQRLLNSVSAVTSVPATTAHGMLTAVVTESEDSTIALDAMISAVESNSDDLSDALKSTIEDAIGNSEEEE